MRLRHLHHSWEWLPEDFELPNDLARDKNLYVWRVQRTPAKDLIALKLGPEQGAGIWAASGKLLHWFGQGADIEFVAGTRQALCLVPLFRKGPGGVGNANALRRLDLASFRTLAEAEIVTSGSHGQYLVLDARGEQGVATWREQREWGYTAFDVRRLAPLPASLEWNTATLSPPAFSPDGSLVVSCHYHRNRWWVDEDGDWYDPSPGGPRKLATLTVHELVTNRASHHDLLVTLDEGWLPDRPEEDEWQAAWGPEFVSEREFRLWLPDGSVEVLRLPLPPQVEISRLLAREREWPES